MLKIRGRSRAAKININAKCGCISGDLSSISSSWSDPSISYFVPVHSPTIKPFGKSCGKKFAKRLLQHDILSWNSITPPACPDLAELEAFLGQHIL